ncbi:MAG: hypothetical protein GY906_07215 [bacterium]|nr:hypothetical protein [bacterium]
MTAKVCLLAAVLVLGNVAQLGSAVVCVGADCDVEVEPLDCNCCAVTDSNNENLPAGLAPSSSSCSYCVDVPLSVPPLKPKTPQLSSTDINADGRTFASTCDGRSDFDFVVHANHMDQHWQSLFSLSTVVLLT